MLATLNFNFLNTQFCTMILTLAEHQDTTFYIPCVVLYHDKESREFILAITFLNYTFSITKKQSK